MKTPSKEFFNGAAKTGDIRRGRPDFLGAARRLKATVTCAAPPDGLPRPPPARRKADAILTAHPLRPARSPSSSTSGIPPGAPPCPRAPGSIRYSAGRQAGRFLLASGKSGNVYPAPYHYGDTCGSRTERSADPGLSSRCPALPSVLRKSADGHDWSSARRRGRGNWSCLRVRVNDTVKVAMIKWLVQLRK